jgi:serine/threonine protein kinase HipA of HipAB toxin-antitoxin module
VFPPTRTSVVDDLSSVDPQARAAAYEALARSYWQPVYAYIRLRRRRSREDAQDLTQEFFARVFEREYLARYDRDEGAVPHVRADLPRRLPVQRGAGRGATETRRRVCHRQR